MLLKLEKRENYLGLNHRESSLPLCSKWKVETTSAVPSRVQKDINEFPSVYFGN